MYELLTEIEINGNQYSIRDNGDYRTILGCFSVLEDVELNQTERILSSLIIFYEDFDDISDIYACPDVEELVKKMYWFFRGGKEEDSNPRNNRKLVDWEGDSDIIVSAINKVAGTEIRALNYMHWWTFLACYMSIGESVLSTVVSIRDKVAKGKKLEKWERDYKANNPQYFKWKSKTVDEIEAEEWLKEVWNKE